MKFSIIVPIHNTELYLKKCLDSIFSQSFKDFEVICILDNCTDSSKSIVQSYKDPRLYVLETSFSKAGLARQAGMNISEGDWFVFVDSDDYFVHPNVLKMLDTYTIGEYTDIKFLNYEIDSGTPAFLQDTLWSHIIRADVAKQMKFRNLDICEDIGFLHDIQRVKQYKKLEVKDNICFYHYTYPRKGSIRYSYEHKE